jgi:hypothetical protein
MDLQSSNGSIAKAVWLSDLQVVWTVGSWAGLSASKGLPAHKAILD